IPMPNMLAVLPGGDRLATMMMRRQIAGIGTETVEQLIERAMDAGVHFQACGMAMELMGYEADDFIEGVETNVGAGTALLDMADSDIQLVI
ncbi:MAG: DsrE/DsrF/DrsH-like family protein, partial [Halobacteriales archaeon]